MTEQRDFAIVVGVDGSPSSRDALRWAVRQAHLTNGRITAVMSWELP
ncbi:universal stress protein, partial [Saccharopolyspora sp. NPDC050389]